VASLPSAKPKLKPEDFSIQKLSEAHKPRMASFLCAGDEEEAFLKEDALKHQNLRLSETFLLIENQSQKLISYMTISFGSFKISENEPLGGVPIREKQTHIFSSHVPCLLIAKLGTDKEEEGRGGGTFLIDLAVQKGLESNKVLALPFVALHSRLDKVDYYKKRGFLVAFTPAKKNEGTITMYRGLMETAPSLPLNF
jgi:hypothetical protein